MQSFRTHRGTVAPLLKDNIDTDQIIPKQFLKRIERTGYGDFLFFDWSRLPDGKPDPAFTLNQPRFQGASILLAGKNFGCGSSREHAAWALRDHGFRAVVAPSFADIFFNNATKNGILPVALGDAEIAYLTEKATAGEAVTIDLERCALSDDRGWSARFDIDTFRRNCLLKGLDEIGVTLEFEPAITAYEKARAANDATGA